MPTVKEADQAMKAAVEATRREFSTVRTGKATPILLDSVRVDAYGTQMPLNQVATVSTPAKSSVGFMSMLQIMSSLAQTPIK